MSKLSPLHSQLAALRRTRQTVRLATAFAGLGIAVLWALACVLVLDIFFELPLLPRLIVMTIAAATCYWAYTKYTQPMLGTRETELDVALMVERQQQIDSDLVAALQFESPDAVRWGSPQLETAVIDYVAEFSSGLNVFEGFSKEQMTRRASVLGVTLLAALIFLLAAPQYAAVFANRLLLGSLHYPTRTNIERVLINDHIVLDRDTHGSSPREMKGPQGHNLSFYVQATGKLPESGLLRVRSARGGTSRPVELRPLTLDQRKARLEEAQARLKEAVEKPEVDITGPWREQTLALLTFDAPAAAEKIAALDGRRGELPAVAKEVQQTLAAWPPKNDSTRIYTGDMGRLVDKVRYGVTVGDAWTDPALILMIPLPVVELSPKITPPRYARNGNKPDAAARQVSVLEGSEVQFALRSVNDKPLKEAWLIAKTRDGAERYAFTRTDDKGLTWSLTGDTPLKRITEEVKYEIQVTDKDDLHLETPIRGVIRLRPDRPPTGSAEVVHRVVLPTARPVIGYRLNDDYGISQVLLKVQIERSVEAAGTPEPGASETSPGATTQDKVETFTLHSPDRPPLLTDQPLRRSYVLDLAPLMLVKGDRLKLTLDITDYRGDTPGESYLSDPLILEISDESGVLAAISEADERSEQRLTDIIKRQLGIGESP